MTTFFSRVRLNPTRRGSRQLIASPQALHAAVMGSHSGAVSTPTGRVLWRLDRPTSHEIELYVVSPSRPDFTGLIEQAGWPTTETWETTEYDGFLARLTSGQQWRFRLTANPVRALARDNARGHVSPHISVEHQQAWLLGRAAAWGFALADDGSGTAALQVSNRHTAAFDRRSVGPDNRPVKGRVAISRCDFTGVLQVDDAELLRQALTSGMGKAKAYGCGLMTLARP
ncbi:MAG: type I-E CRISPR-associated protein Cas6/Cse3/CasE [Micrococcales bacterium]|nr:type I-E CRISPR-associated protein Cas6/Cse3/CasE [Micrococcales bacterium]